MSESRAKGCQRMDLDLRQAVKALKEGRSLCEAAVEQGVSCSTLRRRLVEAGMWPVAVVSGPVCVVP